MLTLLTSILGIATGAIHYAWILLLFLIPSVLDFISPIVKAITEAIGSFIASAWKGATDSTWATWCLVFLVSGIAFGIGYYTGYGAAIDWVHAHFKLIAKVVSTNHWWKFW